MGEIGHMWGQEEESWPWPQRQEGLAPRQAGSGRGSPLARPEPKDADPLQVFHPPPCASSVLLLPPPRPGR